MIKKKKKKHDKIVFLAKTKLNSMEVLISRSLFNSYISHEELVLVIIIGITKNNQKNKQGYDDMKKEIRNLNTSKAHQRF